MKKVIIICLSVVSILSCKSIAIDYYALDKSPASSDVLFIKEITIHASYSIPHLAGNMNRLILFTLQKNHYTATSYLTDPGKESNYRYHASIKAYVNNIGSTIEHAYSTLVFFTITDTKMRKEILTVRASCNGCDLQNVDDQIDIVDTIVTRFDALIKQ